MRWEGVLAALVVGTFGCATEDGGAPPGTGARLHQVPTCPSAAAAPVPDGAGGVRCLPVGLRETMGFERWPDLSSFPTPVAHVETGATGGDGSAALPFGDFAEALATAPGTIALARGGHTPPSTWTVDASVTLVGTGPEGGTDVTAPDAMPALIVTGAGVEVTLLGFAVHAASGAAGIELSGGARAQLENVAVHGGEACITVDGATVGLAQVELAAAERVGLWLRGGAEVTGSDLLVRDGARYGIVARDSALTLSRALVTRHGRDGIALLGGRVGGIHQLTDVASVDNGVTALRVEGSGAELTASRLLLAGTRVPEGTVGGDGFFLGGGASADLDPDIREDARRGHGSISVGNARAGLLAGDSGTQLSLRGALIGSNDGPGVFIQSSAEAAMLGYGRIEDNTALGLGLSSGAAGIVIPCNLISGTREGRLVTESGELVIGDGFSAAGGTRAVQVEGNEISDNARFGAVFSDAEATMRGNFGSGNHFAAGIYGGTVDMDASNAIDGREGAPGAPVPTARSAVGALTPTMP